MYLPEEVVILKYFVKKRNFLFRGIINLILNNFLFFFAKGDGNFECFWWKKEYVFR
jgi:hypothetical protein